DVDFFGDDVVGADGRAGGARGARDAAHRVLAAGTAGEGGGRLDRPRGPVPALGQGLEAAQVVGADRGAVEFVGAGDRPQYRLGGAGRRRDALGAPARAVPQLGDGVPAGVSDRDAPGRRGTGEAVQRARCDEARLQGPFGPVPLLRGPVRPTVQFRVVDRHAEVFFAAAAGDVGEGALVAARVGGGFDRPIDLRQRQFFTAEFLLRPADADAARGRPTVDGGERVQFVPFAVGGGADHPSPFPGRFVDQDLFLHRPTGDDFGDVAAHRGAARFREAGDAMERDVADGFGRVRGVGPVP